MLNFRIKSRSSQLYFWVYVYDDLRQLRKESTVFDKRAGLDGDNMEVYGICHSYRRIKVLSNGGEKVFNNIGIIRLAKNYTSTEIVAHECIHAALWNYRQQFSVSYSANFGRSCSRKEERFADLYGELFRDLCNKLFKYEIWK